MRLGSGTLPCQPRFWPVWAPGCGPSFGQEPVEGALVLGRRTALSHAEPKMADSSSLALVTRNHYCSVSEVNVGSCERLVVLRFGQ